MLLDRDSSLAGRFRVSLVSLTTLLLRETGRLEEGDDDIACWGFKMLLRSEPKEGNDDSVRERSNDGGCCFDRSRESLLAAGFVGTCRGNSSSLDNDVPGASRFICFRRDAGRCRAWDIGVTPIFSPRSFTMSGKRLP